MAIYSYLCPMCDERFASNLMIDELPQVDGDIACPDCADEQYVTDCDYCGEMALCHNDNAGGTRCQSCAEKQK